MNAMKKFCLAMLLCVTLAGLAVAQETPAPAAPASPPTDFLKAADELLLEVSEHMTLPVKSPLKKSLRSREEIREYLVRKLREEEHAGKMHADEVALTKFGLLPRGFALEPFLLDLLTEQIAGLYDPEEQEFYIADWLEPEVVRGVMVHELVHALHDQHFQLKPWMDAAKPSDDAQLARDAVTEGAAMLVMLEFQLRDMGMPVHSAHKMGDMTVFLRSMVAGGIAANSQIAKAPAYIRDVLMFSYVEGAIFSQKVLKAGTGWPDFNRVFEHPPVNSQQILHPELYLASVVPEPVELAAADQVIPRAWKKLDENHIGEFGLHAVLKQFAGDAIANELAPAWAGDTYTIFEDPGAQAPLLLFRVRLQDEATALRFFGIYSDALEKKYPASREFFRRPNFFAFESDEGGVFFHCVATDCLAVEGADRGIFDAVNRALKRPSAPAQPSPSKRRIARIPVGQACSLSALSKTPEPALPVLCLMPTD